MSAVLPAVKSGEIGAQRIAFLVVLAVFVFGPLVV